MGGNGLSAFYSFRYSDCVQLLTDGGFFDDAGVLQKVGIKVIQLGSLPLAVTYRGDFASADRILRELLDYVDTFAVYDAVDPIIPIMQDYFSQLGERECCIEAEFLFAAHCMSGPEHYIVQLHGRGGLAKAKLLSPGWQIAGGPTVTWNDIFGSSQTTESIENPDFPMWHGTQIIGAMRGQKSSVEDQGTQIYGVGGSCYLTTIDANGVTTQKLCDWPDEIGQHIRPNSEPRPSDQ